MDYYSPRHAAGSMPRTMPEGGGIPQRNLNQQLFGKGIRASGNVKKYPNMAYGRGAHREMGRFS